MNCSTCQTPPAACSWSQNPALRGDCCGACAHGPARPPSVQPALDRLADTLGALGVYGRLPYKQAAREAMERPLSAPWLVEFWRCIYDLVESLDEEQEK